jgi:hypothetical protein
MTQNVTEKALIRYRRFANRTLRNALQAQGITGYRSI